MTIHIEICKGWKDGCYNIRIGDIEGAVSTSNISLEELIDIIREEVITELKK